MIKIPSIDNQTSSISCSLLDSVKSYIFPPGIFELETQFLVPEHTSISGNAEPNDMSNPTMSPDWITQTIFIATVGVSDYLAKYCLADDMVNTRVGFVLSSFVTMRNLSFSGIDTIRPEDNGALCGGAAFETKGCAKNDCTNDVNNGGSDGVGSHQVLIENVRINDFFYKEDANNIGKLIPGNYDCKSGDWKKECCFCKSNDIRSSQVGIWIPKTRNKEGTFDITIRNVVSMSTQADGINLHGYVHDVVVENVFIQNTGDDGFAIWGADQPLQNVRASNVEVYNPGILRPNWYGNCVAVYGVDTVVFSNFTCRSPTLSNPLPQPCSTDTRIDTSMFVFYTSFGAKYPEGNQISIDEWAFTDLHGRAYTHENGSIDRPSPGKMAWTEINGQIFAPYYFPNGNKGKVNVVVQ